MYRVGFLLIALLAAVCGLVVGTLNSDRVTLDLLWFQLDWPLGLLVLLTLSIGVLLGMAAAWVFQVLPLQLRLRKARQAADSSQSKAMDTTDA